MGKPIEDLADFAASLRWTDIPADVQAHAKLVCLDMTGVMLAGALRPEIQDLRTRLLATAGTGATLLAPGMPTTDPRIAAMLNGIAGRSIELCDGMLGVQPSVQILPALLAIGEQNHCSGHDLLTALIIGYEIAGRFAQAFTPRPFAHGNGQIALLAAVAAAAHLRGFNAADISRAMRIATTLLMTPSYLSTTAGATALNIPGGMSGFAAILAPDLALAGYIARDDAIEEALGQMVGDGFDTTHLTDGLGSSWMITQNYFRFYACCNPIHPVLDCLLDINPADIANIDRIDAATHAFAAVMANPDPPNHFASKYSFPHAAAVLLLRGGLGYADLDDIALTDLAIAALRSRIHLTEDKDMSARAPDLRQARVTVTWKDGRQITASRDMSRYDQDKPDPDEPVRAKFAELAGTILTETGVRHIEAAINGAGNEPLAVGLMRIARQTDLTNPANSGIRGADR